MRGNRKPVREDNTGPRSVLAACHVCEIFLVYDVFSYVFFSPYRRCYSRPVFLGAYTSLYMLGYATSGDESHFSHINSKDNCNS